ncbi:GntR family transcriptional regulator [Paracoccus spongiarum]|uniref:GntR family transcriptional regulator n=1 Tax=Paracoccus spongiarum TaxID=3064387 RepID=A0ABT9JAH7_9RHOB|nr:GntR family transcriptional regulator [Paracoccus sp. 2205BS29-5]MDP5306817.1 GntR family transcriptional regulator [Paracoccus sp. 2205BS29-5]
MQPARRKRSRADMIHDALRQMIVTLELRPRQALPEKDLCARFDTSRTPLREAILRLAEHGLVTIAPQHGTFVAGISPRAVRQAHFLRESLEVPVIRRLTGQPGADLTEAADILTQQKILAARNDQAGFLLLDDRFHEALFTAAGLGELWAVIHAKKGHLDRIRFIQGNMRGSVQVPLVQHVEILEAVRRGAAPEAEALMRAHVAGSLSFLERSLHSHPDLFDADPPEGAELAHRATMDQTG